MKNKASLWILLAASVTNMTGHITMNEAVIQFTKPTLMPLLLYYIYISSKGYVTIHTLRLCLAILLSWVGDIALMYEGDTYFLIGVGFFLAAHITYIFVLFKSCFQPPSLEIIKVVPFVLYTIALFKLILPHSGSFTIPVLIYGVVIAAMASMSRLREGNTSQISYRLVLFGSILFVISDSLLAIDKFYANLPFAGVWIMSSYIAAQFLIVEGILKHQKDLA